jgi:hypothetical protein
MKNVIVSFIETKITECIANDKVNTIVAPVDFKGMVNVK